MPALNFPPEYIENAVNGSVTRYTRRVDIFESDNTTLWMSDVRVKTGSVSVDQTRAERRAADLTLLSVDGDLRASRDDGLWYDKIIGVTMGVDTPSGNWEQSIGRFVMDSIGTANSRGEVKLACRDFTKRMKYSLPYPIAWAENTPIENIITALATGASLPTTVDLPLTGINTDQAFFFDQGVDRWDSAYEVATAYGYDLWFDAGGDLQLTPFEDPMTTQPQFTFETGARSNVVDIGRKISDGRIRNHIAVHGKATDESPVWGEAINDVADSPTNIFELGLRTETYSSAWVTTFDQARGVAERRLKFSSLEQWEASLSTVIVPWLEAGIISHFIDPEAAPGDPDRYLLSKFNISLDLKPASAELARITDVIDLNPEYPGSDVYPEDDLYPNEEQL